MLFDKTKTRKELDSLYENRRGIKDANEAPKETVKVLAAASGCQQQNVKKAEEGEGSVPSRKQPQRRQQLQRKQNKKQNQPRSGEMKNQKQRRRIETRTAGESNKNTSNATRMTSFGVGNVRHEVAKVPRENVTPRSGTSTSRFDTSGLNHSQQDKEQQQQPRRQPKLSGTEMQQRPIVSFSMQQNNSNVINLDEFLKTFECATLEQSDDNIRGGRGGVAIDQRDDYNDMRSHNGQELRATAASNIVQNSEGREILASNSEFGLIGKVTDAAIVFTTNDTTTNDEFVGRQKYEQRVHGCQYHYRSPNKILSKTTTTASTKFHPMTSNGTSTTITKHSKGSMHQNIATSYGIRLKSPPKILSRDNRLSSRDLSIVQTISSCSTVQISNLRSSENKDPSSETKRRNGSNELYTGSTFLYPYESRDDVNIVSDLTVASPSHHRENNKKQDMMDDLAAVAVPKKGSSGRKSNKSKLRAKRVSTADVYQRRRR